MVNGEVPHNPGMLEETLHQMNILIQENRDLKGECKRVPGCSAVSSFCGAFICIHSHSTHELLYPLHRVAASDQPDDEGTL